MNFQNGANLSPAPAVASATFIQDTSNTNNAAPGAQGINNYSNDGDDQRREDDSRTPLTPPNNTNQQLAPPPVTIMVHCESNCANHQIVYEE